MAHATIPLSPFGVARAAAIVELLDVQPSKVLVSKYLRARAKEKPFCDQVGCSAEVHPLLHEISALDAATLMAMTGK